MPVGSAADLRVGRIPRDGQVGVMVGRGRHHLSLSRLVDALLRIVVQYLHVFSGILWIGGGFYTIVVQLPAVLAMPPAARGPAMAQLVPRQWKYILRVAELTIFWGFVNVFVL